jgi:hypothetical protein
MERHSQQAPMSHFDVFNGDADGICALHQLRLAAPRASTLVTGVKRDIELLGRVAALPGDSVTVLDISLDRNREALLSLLNRGVQVEYFDHHFSGPIPQHRELTAHIDAAPDVCTSVLVDRQLQGLHRAWAVVAAFGDNLGETARALALSCGLNEDETTQLCELGEGINYNAYGAGEADLLIPPADLYRALRPYASPFDFIARDAIAGRLSEGRRRDMALAQRQEAAIKLATGRIYVLPDAAWAHRVQGAFANHLAVRFPELAHAVLCGRVGDGYSVSVRAPVARPKGAERLCRKFPGGGGRAGAAGIDELAAERLQEFAEAFSEAFGATAERDTGHVSDSNR